MKNFGYFFKEGARSMFSHGFMSFAAIGVTVACLLIMGTFSLVAYNANENLADLQKENAMVAFVDDSLTESKAKALQSDLEKVDNVADCTFVSRQEARDAYVAEMAISSRRSNVVSLMVLEMMNSDTISKMAISAMEIAPATLRIVMKPLEITSSARTSSMPATASTAALVWDILLGSVRWIT